MLATILALSLIGTAAYFFLRSRRTTAETAKTKNNHAAGIPTRVLNPSGYKNIPLVIAWEFVAPNLSKSCKFARDHAGMRKAAADCTPLPLADCGSDACLCHYRPIFDERKRVRRKDHDRRKEYRMDDKEERRAGADRRRDNHSWHDRHIK